MWFQFVLLFCFENLAWVVTGVIFNEFTLFTVEHWCWELHYSISFVILFFFSFHLCGIILPRHALLSARINSEFYIGFNFISEWILSSYFCRFQQNRASFLSITCKLIWFRWYSVIRSNRDDGHLRSSWICPVLNAIQKVTWLNRNVPSIYAMTIIHS